VHHPSNTNVQNPASLRQAIAAIGILVGLAIVVPIAGIVMVPAVALTSLARAILGDVVEMRTAGRADRSPAGALASRRPVTRGLSALGPSSELSA
jgi:hypothetical protein